VELAVPLVHAGDLDGDLVGVVGIGDGAGTGAELLE
jgi:hypothetical protein